MGLFKKNPIFCSLCVVAVLVFAGGTTLTISESSKRSKLQAKVASVEGQINGLLFASPAPTADNVQAAKQNAKALNAKLLSLREGLQRGSRLTVSSDGTRVMSGLQKYISNFRKQAAVHENEDGEAAPIDLPDDFAFGFDEYLGSPEISEDAAIVSNLDKQRQVLSYILNQLIEANPAAIKAVEREVLEDTSTSRKGSTGFRISPVVSARVPDAIDTVAFRVTFTGHTPVLRKFLNNLAQFDLPIVVRGVEVERPTVSTKQAKAKKNAKSNLDDIFSVDGGSSSSNSETPAAAPNQTPVVSETESSFTVTLEFIEIVLPTNSEETPS